MGGGLEVAGVVLGLYPVITGLAEQYRNLKGSGSASVSNRTEVASVLYEDIARQLLATVASRDEVQRLVDIATKSAGREDALWSGTDLGRKVTARLGKAKFEVILSLLAEMRTLLEEAKSDLDNKCRGTVCIGEPDPAMSPY